MKIFKLIYYPVMAILLCLTLIFGFVDSTQGSTNNKLGESFLSDTKAHLEQIAAESHNSYNEDAMNRVRSYITGRLDKLNVIIADVGVNDDGDDVYLIPKDNNFKPVNTYVVQTDIVSPDTLDKISYVKTMAKDDELYIEAGKEINNIIVYLPGTDTLTGYTGVDPKASGDVIMMMAHYDTRPEGDGASDNSVAVSSMISNIEYIIKNGKTFKNDLLFVFTDAEEEGLYGAYAFKYQFLGFDDIFSRVKLGTNFDALGPKGSMIMFQSSDNNYKLISEYSNINGSAFTSSIANFVYGAMPTFTDYEIYDGITSLNFANVGGSQYYHTSYDEIGAVSDSIIIQHSNMMNSVYEKFGNYNLNTLEGTKNAVYFSYLDLVTVVYPYLVSYVMGGLIIGLFAFVIFLNVKRKTFRLSQMGKGLAVQLLSILASVVVLFVFYYAISLILSIFGVIPLHAIGKITYSSIGLVVSVMLLTTIISSAFIMLLRRAFNVKALDIVHGNVLLWVLIGAVLSFLAPHLGYFFSVTALLEVVVLLFMVMFAQKIRDKFKVQVGRFFPYMLPLIITLPMIIPVIMIASMVLNLTFMPIIMILFMMMSGFITPYFGLLKGILDKLFAKLPQRNIKVKNTVTEMVEDKAKKGKFTQKTYKKVTIQKTVRRYNHAIGFSVLAGVFCVMIILFSSFGFNYGMNFAVKRSYRDSLYSGSLVYVWEKDGTGTSISLEVTDVTAYKYIRNAVDGLSWDRSKNAYVKPLTLSSDITPDTPSIQGNAKEVSFTVANPTRSQVRIQLTDASNISEITVKSKNGDREYTFENKGLSTITIDLPYGVGKFDMLVEGATTLKINYSEYNWDNNALYNISEWNNLLSYYADNENVADYIRGGIVYRYTLAI